MREPLGIFRTHNHTIAIIHVNDTILGNNVWILLTSRLQIGITPYFKLALGAVTWDTTDDLTIYCPLNSALSEYKL